jgi:glycosyltransferase involved in cell wall biosynthesis
VFDPWLKKALNECNFQMSDQPTFSIVTPSFNQPDFLKRAMASLADQSVSHEHIIQDAGSSAETLSWLQQDSRAKLYVEKDSGMYDALNRGFARTTGKYLAWLNCDEQYLSGTLQKVEAAWKTWPEVDLFYGDSLLVNTKGELLAFRKLAEFSKREWYPAPFPILSCSLFFTRKLWEKGIQFDPKLRGAGDWDWFLRCLEGGARAKHLPGFLGTYTFTGKNLSHDGKSLEETRRLTQLLPASSGLNGKWNKLTRWISKWQSGCYSSGPIEYELYSETDFSKRQTFRCENPTFRWPC